MRAGEKSARRAGENDGAALETAVGLAAARPSGALWLPGARALIVSDLHLGKAERLARRGGPFLPPYEVAETLARLEAEIAALNPRHVACLGDSFDDPAAARRLDPADWRRLAALAAGRRWTWISGNHDPTVATPFGPAAPMLALGAAR